MKNKFSLKACLACVAFLSAGLASCNAPVAPSNAGIAILGGKDVMVGKTIKLTTQATGGISDIAWKSDDEKIAKVDAEGNVTGVSIGETVITAYSSYYKQVLDSVNIRVLADQTFTVTFKNFDGSVLYSEDVEKGGLATYEGETPTRPSSDVENYTFFGWDKDLNTPINEDTTFIAQYDVTAIDFSEWLYQYSEQYQGYMVAYNGSESELTLPTSYNYRPVVGYLGLSGNTNLTSVVVPEGYKVIYQGAFADDTNLASVTLPSTLIEIQMGAFSNTGLTEISVPEGVTTIAQSAFANNKKLVSASLPSTLTAIPDYAFSNDSSLETVNIPSGITKIGNNAFFTCSSLKGDLVIPNGVTEIGNQAFFWTSYTKVVLPSSLTTIPEIGPFAGMRFVEEISLDGESDTFAVDNNVLYSKDGKKLIWIAPKTNAQSITIKEGVTDVSSYAGYYLNVPEVILPSSVKSVGAYAFADSQGLKKLVFTDHADKSDLTFDTWTLAKSVSLEEVVLPEGLTKIPDYFADNCSKLTKVNFPSTLKSIGYSAFGETSIQSIEFPSTIEEIGGFAFFRTPVTSVVFPDSVKSIGDNAFFKCASLQSVTLPKNPTYIGSGVFEDCVKLDTLVGGMPLLPEDSDGEVSIPDFLFANTALTSFVVPSGYTKINFGAFGHSKINTVTLPLTLKTIEIGAFGDTTINLINYEGSEEDFKKISISTDTNDYYGSNTDGITASTEYKYNVK